MLKLACLVTLSVVQALEVEISNGIVRGHTKTTRNGRSVFAFESIPYAKPPIAERRFKAPVPVENWEGKLDGTQKSSKCLQRNTLTQNREVTGQEDCLYLNVYTPRLRPTDQKGLPVMVFIFGNSYIAGSADSDDYGPEILLDWDVILVVPNYRLGALGFLTTGDENAPGNFGLKDQTLALKWVQQNIATFGGDPKSVTIFGNGAGGSAVYLHGISSLSQGLFNRSIIQSGAPFSLWSYYRTLDTAVSKTLHLASAFGCQGEESSEIVACLRKIPAEAIIAADHIFFEWDVDPIIPFRPVIEPESPEAFLTKDPRAEVKARDFIASDLILGFNMQDGCERPAAIFSNKTLLKEFDENYLEIWPITLKYRDDSLNPNTATESLRNFYFGEKAVSEQTRSAAIDMYTDTWYENPADYAARIHVPLEDYDKFYYYVFNCVGEESSSPTFGDNIRDYGSCHKNELFYLFPMRNLLNGQVFKSTANDDFMINVMGTLWTNFAIYGEPTPETSDLSPNKWIPLGKNTLEYFGLNLKPSMRSDADLARRLRFFKEVIANKMYDKNDV